MSDIVKGVLGGGWSLLVGWILPAALSLILFRFVVVPSLGDFGPAKWLREADPQQQGIALLAGAAVLGLLLAALQTPLYRLLEGYIGWQPGSPAGWERWLRSPLNLVLSWSHRHQLKHKQILLGRIDLVELSQLEKKGTLRDELHPRLAAVRADKRLNKYADMDSQRTASQLGLLREKVRRYPVDDAQVLPTRFGNAIRRLEEYGYDRFRLDSQTFWYELSAIVPEHARKQVDQARTTLDFLVCLLYGNLFVALSTLIALGLDSEHPWPLAAAAGALLILTFLWYRIAIGATDDWAAATRALVNLGRKPLADALGLQLPAHLDDERTMWARAARLSARPYDSRSSEIDAYSVPSEPARKALASAPPGPDFPTDADLKREPIRQE